MKSIDEVTRRLQQHVERMLELCPNVRTQWTGSAVPCHAAFVNRSLLSIELHTEGSPHAIVAHIVRCAVGVVDVVEVRGCPGRLRLVFDPDQ